MALVSIDGSIVNEALARVSVFDRGLLYGDGVFETIRVYSGVPFALRDHVVRLAESAARIGIVLPASERALANEIVELLNQCEPDDAHVRIVVTRGAGPLGPSAAFDATPTRFIIATPIGPQPESLYADGVSAVTIAQSHENDALGIHSAKTLNYLRSILALREAQSRGAPEALFVDRRGHVLEGATSNLFYIANDRLFTPSENVGILAGITRKFVLELAMALSIPVSLIAPNVATLVSADEAFLTSSIREIVPLVGVDGSPIGKGVVGPLTREIHRAYRMFVEQHRLTLPA